MTTWNKLSIMIESVLWRGRSWEVAKPTTITLDLKDEGCLQPLQCDWKVNY